MNPDADACYQALLARDPRFDGQLFIGVTSTGVYCRPICRVRTPMRKNCRFFTSAAQAEAAAFRPCLKCRPEIAPGAGLPWSVMDASRTLARQAALAFDAEVEADADDGAPTGVAALAARLGVSDRHLRRIFAAEHGVTPLQYLQTRRLLLAKQLLTDTRLPVAQVALTSGFRSLRRFNAAFASSYRMNPSRLRRAAAEPATADLLAPALSVTLAYRPPYDVAALLRFMAYRAIPGVEVIEGRSIRRTLRAGAPAATAGWIEATFLPTAAQVRLRFAPSLAALSGRIVSMARRWLDLDATPETIDTTLDALPGAPGLRLPGCVDGFELAVRAVLGQQVTVAAARTLARRLVERFGVAVTTPWSGVERAFPSPQQLAAAPLAAIAELGIIRTRAGAIGALAQIWPEVAPLMQSGSDPAALIERLRGVAGVGPWTTHYIAMRALGWPDAFPPNDVAVLKAMNRLFRTTSMREVEVHAQAWQPWRSYAVLRLWNTLEKAP